LFNFQGTRHLLFPTFPRCRADPSLKCSTIITQPAALVNSKIQFFSDFLHFIWPCGESKKPARN